MAYIMNWPPQMENVLTVCVLFTLTGVLAKNSGQLNVKKKINFHIYHIY